MNTIYLLIFILFFITIGLGVYLVYLIYQLQRDFRHVSNTTINSNAVIEKIYLLFRSLDKNYYRLVQALTHKPVDSQRMEGGKDDH